MAIEWDDAYSTGVAEIDEQHKTLFAFSNELERELESSIDRRAVDRRLQFLSDYAKTHFVLEEICMKHHRCPVAAKNKNAHRHFLTAFQALRARFDDDGATPAMVAEIHQMVESWLLEHICKIDAQLRTCVSKKG